MAKDQFIPGNAVVFLKGAFKGLRGKVVSRDMVGSTAKIQVRLNNGQTVVTDEDNALLARLAHSTEV